MNISKSTNISIITSAIRKAIKPLMRDYGEIHYLQSSPKGTVFFVQKSYERVRDILYSELRESRPNYSIIDPSSPSASSANVTSEYRWLVEPLNGYKNFEHGIPLFCIAITLEKFNKGQYEPIASVVDAPAIEECYFAEKGGGAWSENYSRFSRGSIRMRVSKRASVQEALILANYPHQKYRNYYAEYLHFAFVANGKADACIIKSDKIEQFSGIKLIIEESGGFFKTSSDTIIASNAVLKDQLDNQ